MMRLDLLLWYLRLAPTRNLAQARIAEGHIRISGRRAERCATLVRVGDIIVMPQGQNVLLIEIIALPQRRGPAPEAQTHYRVLDGAGNIPIAATGTLAAIKGVPQP